MGTGKKPEKPCKTCRGSGRVDGKSAVTIRIPPGIHTGQRLKVTGEGGAGIKRGLSGDLYVSVQVADDSDFLREGDDVRSHITISVPTAILGTTMDVATLHGSVSLRIPEGTQPGDVLRIKGKGMPVLSSSRFGDHYIDIAVEIPRKLSRAERKLLEEWKELE